ncbi:endonuclease/exonuclease/phosphatase family protein [Marinilabiliaceae bacterium ANBcel2]|nr:endonuclease/exonuclease/phosphatase family protein [Marinilabiliaceae bacterium ANBcel2]
MRCLLSILTIFYLFTGCLSSQSYESEKLLIAFYNVENLFDIVNNPDINDDEFTPDGNKKWTLERYNDKIDQIAEVIAALGEKDSIDKPAIVGLCEVENGDVLNDLINSDLLADYNFDFVHYTSPDLRGIDVALLYRKDLFDLINSHPVELVIGSDNNRFYTRDQLVVSGKLAGEKIHFIVNHWPSRFGGAERSRHLRNIAAELCRSIVDSLENIYNDPQIVVMGDLNDNPNDESIVNYLNAGSEASKLKSGELYNTTAQLYFEGGGTSVSRDEWQLYNHMIISQSLLEESNSGFYYRYNSATIFDAPFITVQTGRYKGTPYRTYVGDYYLGGYSDHYPVYIILEQFSK